MNSIISFIVAHAAYAHWFAFGLILLAGFGMPVSIEVVVLICAFLAATVVPEHTWLLFASCALGCLVAAWIAYWMGRLLGTTLLKRPLFAKLLPEARLKKAQKFYEKWGLAAFMIGRFIPFGVRIGLFVTSGISRMPFGKFVLKDAIAGLTWCSIAFFLFYSLGQNYQVLYHYLKTFNLVIFSLFSIGLIAFIWVKKKKTLRKKAAKELS